MAKRPGAMEQCDPLMRTIHKVYERLIRSKAMANALNDDKKPELRWAMTCDEDGDTPLHIAVAKGDEVVTKRLIKCLQSGNVSLNTKNKLLQTPFHVACITDNSTLAALFIEADPGCVDVADRHGNNGVHLAVKHSCQETNYATLQVVVDASTLSTLESRNIYGLAPMHLAAQLNNARAVSLLRQAGADVNIPDNKGGAPPIVLATRASRREAAQALLELGANPNLRTTYGETASQVASAKSDRALSELLAFYDTPYDVSRQSTSSHYSSDFEQPRSSKSTIQLHRPTYPVMKSDLYSGAFAPNRHEAATSSAMTQQPGEVDRFQAAVKVERSSPSKYPPFPASENVGRREKEGAARREVERKRIPSHFINHFHQPGHSQFLTGSSELIPPSITPRHSTNRPPAAESRGALRSNGADKNGLSGEKRKARCLNNEAKQDQDLPLDLSFKRHKATNERAAPAVNTHAPHQSSDFLESTSNRNFHVRDVPRSHDKPLANQQQQQQQGSRVQLAPPPYPHFSVIMSGVSAATSTRPRRYRSDESYHSDAVGGILSEMEKQALERRRSAPDDLKRAYSGRRQMDLHSYTGCLPPHYLHLLESSGNLPIRPNHVLRNVADIFGGLRAPGQPRHSPASSSSYAPEEIARTEPHAAPTSVIVMSSTRNSDLGRRTPERYPADKGCRISHVTESKGEHQMSSNETPRSPTSQPSQIVARVETQQRQGVGVSRVEGSVDDMTHCPNSSKKGQALPQLGTKQVASTNDVHNCSGCSQRGAAVQAATSFTFAANKPYRKYVIAALESEPSLVYCNVQTLSDDKKISAMVDAPNSSQSHLAVPTSNVSSSNHEPVAVGTQASHLQSRRISETSDVGSIPGSIGSSTVSQNESEEVPSKRASLQKPSFHKTSFSDTECLDVTSDDSGTDVTEPKPESRAHEHTKLRRKNSLDAKMEQLRLKALNSHQSHYKRACAEEPRDDVRNRDEADAEQEDLLANSIEDSESENEDSSDVVLTTTKQETKVSEPGNPPALPSSSRTPVSVQPFLTQDAAKLYAQLHNAGVGVGPVLPGNVARVNHAVMQSSLQAAIHYNILRQQRLQKEILLQHRNKIPSLLYYDSRKRRCRQPDKVQVFPPKSSRLSSAKAPHSDDLELGDLEISDEEDYQQPILNGIKKTQLVYF